MKFANLFSCHLLWIALVLVELNSATSASSTRDIIVSFHENRIPELRSQFKARSFPDRGSKLTSYYNVLKSHSDSVQSDVLSVLERAKLIKAIKVAQLWITNEISVRGADEQLVKTLLTHKDVSSVRDERLFHIDAPTEILVHPRGTVPTEGEQWGVLDVQAPEVWAQGNRGAGAVIATIDSGVRLTHEALEAGWRTEYGWFNPTDKTEFPWDLFGHGTHVTGTIAGRTNGIGVAPEAQWISCKGCNDRGGCSEFDLLGCGQWVLCPTDYKGNNPNCSMAPNAASNSWGGGQGELWYEEVIQSWAAVDIVPLFSNGNAGPQCGTAGSPGDSENAIGVGSIIVDGRVSAFSSVGPSAIGNRIKPDIAAPGDEVISAFWTADDSYATYSGTSMACPHASGVAALLFSADPNLTPKQVRDLLIAGAKPTTSIGQSCDNIPDNQFPNHQAGYGKINALSSLAALEAMKSV